VHVAFTIAVQFDSTHNGIVAQSAPTYPRLHAQLLRPVQCPLPEQLFTAPQSATTEHVTPLNPSLQTQKPAAHRCVVLRWQPNWLKQSASEAISVPQSPSTVRIQPGVHSHNPLAQTP
jgi:hypothetical protein